MFRCQKLYTARKKFTLPSVVPVATKTMTGAGIAVFFRVTIYLAVEVKFCGIFVTFLPLLFFWGNWIERVWKFDTFGPQLHNDLGFTVWQKLSLSNKQNHNPSPFETLFRTKSWITLGTCLTYTDVCFFSNSRRYFSLQNCKSWNWKVENQFPLFAWVCPTFRHFCLIQQTDVGKQIYSRGYWKTWHTFLRQKKLQEYI